MKKKEVTKLQGVIQNNENTSIIEKAKSDIKKLSKHNPKQIKNKTKLKKLRARR